MPFAYINEDGSIAEVVHKLNPLRVRAGQRIVAYNPPSYDSNTQTLEVVQPVPPEAVEVEMLAVDLPNATALREAVALRQIDEDVDSIYTAAIGNRGPEYTQAELEATAFASNGYNLESVPEYVNSWAVAGGMSPQAAADSILTQAQQWRHAAASLRANRLQAKARIRAGDPTALEDWQAYILQIRQSLGIA